jgi:hypothetical protein
MDRPRMTLTALALDITRQLITKNWKQVASNEVAVFKLGLGWLHSSGLSKGFARTSLLRALTAGFHRVWDDAPIGSSNEVPVPLLLTLRTIAPLWAAGKEVILNLDLEARYPCPVGSKSPPRAPHNSSAWSTWAVSEKVL